MSVPAVLDITVVRDRGVTVEYEDGAICEFPLAELRAACPCAECRAVRERGGTPGPPAARAEGLRIDDAALAGAWGISISWSDGHGTGIYPWDSLRRWYDGATDGVVVTD